MFTGISYRLSQTLLSVPDQYIYTVKYILVSVPDQYIDTVEYTSLSPRPVHLYKIKSSSGGSRQYSEKIWWALNLTISAKTPYL